MEKNKGIQTVLDLFDATIKNNGSIAYNNLLNKITIKKNNKKIIIYPSELTNTITICVKDGLNTFGEIKYSITGTEKLKYELYIKEVVEPYIEKQTLDYINKYLNESTHIKDIDDFDDEE